MVEVDKIVKFKEPLWLSGRVFEKETKNLRFDPLRTQTIIISVVKVTGTN